MKIALRIAMFSLLFALSLNCFSQTAKKRYRYSLPDKRGAVEFSLEGLQLTGIDMNPDGTGIEVIATDRESGRMATIFIEVAKRPGGAVACRDTWWPKSREALKSPMKAKINDLREYELGEAVVVEFTVLEALGQALNQKDIHGYLAGGDIWVEIHLTETPSRSDSAVLSNILKSAHLIADYAPTETDYLQFASYQYRIRNYRQAAKYYERSRELNEATGKFGSESIEWKVMMDNLGMAYGISGRLQDAKRTFEYALAKNPSYPMFYYNLACTFAEMGDLENALVNLRKAYEYRGNMLPNERIPDPMTDNSFKRYVKNAQFQAVAKTLKD